MKGEGWRDGRYGTGGREEKRDWERWIDAEEAGGEGTRTVNLTQNLNK